MRWSCPIRDICWKQRRGRDEPRQKECGFEIANAVEECPLKDYIKAKQEEIDEREDV